MHITVKVVVTDSAVTALCSFSLSQCCAQFAVTVLCSFSLSQCCAHFHCHSAVLISLSQCCARFHCHSPVLISLSQCCAHRCLTAIGFLLCTFNYAKHIDGSNSSQKRFVSYSLMIAKQKYPILLQVDAFLHHSATAYN